jgi:hypothetical protein
VFTQEFYRNESVPEGEKPTRYCYLPYLTLPPPDIQLPLPELIDLKDQKSSQQLHPNSGPSGSFAAAPPPYTPEAGADPSCASGSTSSRLTTQDHTDIERLLKLSPEELSNLPIGTLQAALLRVRSHRSILFHSPNSPAFQSRIKPAEKIHPASKSWFKIYAKSSAQNAKSAFRPVCLFALHSRRYNPN